MKIDYFAPLSKAWERMKKALFQPFDIGKWFALGFTVFLAHLLDGGGFPGNFRSSFNREKTIRLPDIENIPERVINWLHSHPFLIVGILMGVLVCISIILVFTWLSSRGAFMFLDNVVHDRALIVKPWREYKILGNSLFFWRIGFGFVVGLLMLPFLISIFILLRQFPHGHYALYNILGISLLGLLWLLGSVIVAYISLFTHSFVVPIMYKFDLKILQAWQKFLPILKSHFLYFILFGLLCLLLFIVIVIAAFVTGCLTCCIGFLILFLPYVSSVFLLPVYFTLRAFSLEFLAQWGTDYSVFPDEALPFDDVPPPPIPPPAGANTPGM
ncbi:MAG: hypothetical protein P8Y80_12720 [Acidobacteriota bacterium]|jgi:hypothetical protein